MTLLASDQVSGPDAAAIAEAIRVSLGAPGFRIRVRLEPPDTADAAARQGTAELTLHEETLDVNDPDVFFRRLLGTDGATPGAATNVAFFRSPLVDGMLSRAGQLGFRRSDCGSISASRRCSPRSCPTSRCTPACSGWSRGPR
jgi:hypothetical protein